MSVDVRVHIREPETYFSKVTIPLTIPILNLILPSVAFLTPQQAEELGINLIRQAHEARRYEKNSVQEVDA